MPAVIAPLSTHAVGLVPVAGCGLVEAAGWGVVAGAAGVGAGVAAAAAVAAWGAGPATVKTNEPSFGSPSSPETLCHRTRYCPGPQSRIGMLAVWRSSRLILAGPVVTFDPSGPVIVNRMEAS